MQWVRTFPFGRSHRTADMAAVRHRNSATRSAEIFRSLGASVIKGAEHCIAPVSPRSSSTNWRPLMCAGEWQRPQHVELVGMYSRSQRASQSESQPQFQGLWWRWSSTRNFSGVKRSWGSELRLLWAKFSSTKEARSSNAFRSICPIWEFMIHNFLSENSPLNEPGLISEKKFSEISSSSSPTRDVRLGISPWMLHIPRLRYLRLARPSNAPSEMYSSFLSSPRSNLIRDGTRLNAYEGMLSIGLFLSHNSRSLDRYSNAPLGTTVNLLSNSSSVLRLVSPLKAPTSICLMALRPSCNTSRWWRLRKESPCTASMAFSIRFRCRVLLGIPGGTRVSPRLVHTTLLSWLLQEQSVGQPWGPAAAASSTHTWTMRNRTQSRAAFLARRTATRPRRLMMWHIHNSASSGGGCGGDDGGWG